MKTKIVAAVALVALLSVALIGGTMAWLTDKDEAVNTFTFGKVAVDLKETSVGVVGEKDGLEFYKIVPGETYSKEPYVKNIGSVDCYVRVKVDYTTFPSEQIDLNNLCKEGSNWVKGLDDTEEEYNKYYYYTEKLSPEKVTNKLFDSVKINGNVTNEDIKNLENSNFNIKIDVEAIQADGIDDVVKVEGEKEGTINYIDAWNGLGNATILGADK